METALSGAGPQAVRTKPMPGYIRIPEGFYWRGDPPFKEFIDIHDVAPILVHQSRKNTESENSFDRISAQTACWGGGRGLPAVLGKGRVILTRPGRKWMILDFDPQRCPWTVAGAWRREIAEPPEPLLISSTKMIGGGWQDSHGAVLSGCATGPGAPFTANTLTRKLNAPHPPAKGEKASNTEVLETGEFTAHLPRARRDEEKMSEYDA